MAKGFFYEGQIDFLRLSSISRGSLEQNSSSEVRGQKRSNVIFSLFITKNTKTIYIHIPLTVAWTTTSSSSKIHPIKLQKCNNQSFGLRVLIFFSSKKSFVLFFSSSSSFYIWHLMQIDSVCGVRGGRTPCLRWHSGGSGHERRHGCVLVR